VQHKFPTTKSHAEGFTTALEEHYFTAQKKIDLELQKLERAMTAKMQEASLEQEVYEALLAKTIENISKHEKRLEENKKRKLDGLRPERKTAWRRTSRETDKSA